jgi:hypothetical protein
VVDVFADGQLLVSVGDDDYAEKGDTFVLVRGTAVSPNAVASAKIISLGKRFSIAAVELPAKSAKPEVGDKVTLTAWKQRQDILDASMQRGGAILINGK